MPASWDYLAAVRKIRSGITSTDKHVLLTLASYVNHAGECFPSVAQIAEDTLMSEKSISRSLARLLEAGLVRREERTRRNGSRTTDLLILVVGVDNLSEESAILSGKRDKMSPPEPTKEPTKEPPPSEDAREDSRPKTARASRLSEDWTPSAGDRDYARNLGFSDDRIDAIAENFRDYWVAKAGEAARKTNWELTWRSWVRREAERIPRARRGSGPSRGPQIEGGLF